MTAQPPISTYRVSRDASGQHRWWPPCMGIPAHHTAIRQATLDEEALIRRIRKSTREPRDLIHQLGDLMAEHDARNPGAGDE